MLGKAYILLCLLRHGAAQEKTLGSSDDENIITKTENPKKCTSVLTVAFVNHLDEDADDGIYDKVNSKSEIYKMSENVTEILPYDLFAGDFVDIDWPEENTPIFTSEDIPKASSRSSLATDYAAFVKKIWADPIVWAIKKTAEDTHTLLQFMHFVDDFECPDEIDSRLESVSRENTDDGISEWSGPADNPYVGELFDRTSKTITFRDENDWNTTNTMTWEQASTDDKFKVVKYTIYQYSSSISSPFAEEYFPGSYVENTALDYIRYLNKEYFDIDQTDREDLVDENLPENEIVVDLEEQVEEEPDSDWLDNQMEDDEGVDVDESGDDASPRLEDDEGVYVDGSGDDASGDYGDESAVEYYADREPSDPEDSDLDENAPIIVAHADRGDDEDSLEKEDVSEDDSFDMTLVAIVLVVLFTYGLKSQF